MHVASLWRYPVKSLRGEQLEVAQVTPDGISGDRVVHVAGAHGPLTGRTRHGLLSLPASTSPDGVALVDGHRWDSDDAARLVAERAGADARLVADTSPERFDVLNMLVATDRAVAALGADFRRLRPNLLMADVGDGPEGDETTWPGQALEIGEVLIGLHSVRGRCIVTSIDPDSGEQDLDVFRRIRRDFDGEMALNSWVIRPGVIRVGDTARLVPLESEPTHLGGWIVGADYPYAAGA
jgi:uncharacterized protein